MSEHGNYLEQRGNAELVRFAVMRAITCPGTGRVLDARTAVLVMPSEGAARVVSGSWWDEKRAEIEERATEHGVTLEVHDGRTFSAGVWADVFAGGVSV